MSFGSVAAAFSCTCLEDAGCVEGAEDEDDEPFVDAKQGNNKESNRDRFKRTGATPHGHADYVARIRVRHLGRSAAFEDSYQVLGIAPSATAQEIKRAYVRKALRLHPDRRKRRSKLLVDADELDRQWASVSKAYTVLSDEEQRVEYDANMPLRNALVMFYQRHNATQLYTDKIERTVRAYAKDPVFLFRYLNSIYNVVAYTRAEVTVLSDTELDKEVKRAANYQKVLLVDELLDAHMRESKARDLEQARFMNEMGAKATQIASAWRTRMAVQKRQDAEAARIEHCGVTACSLNPEQEHALKRALNDAADGVWVLCIVLHFTKTNQADVVFEDLSSSAVATADAEVTTVHPRGDGAGPVADVELSMLTHARGDEEEHCDDRGSATDFEALHSTALQEAEVEAVQSVCKANGTKARPSAKIKEGQ
eukprot:g2007.t1